tara:strand:- start:292 stop:705 length:414 start_codon:yes stop_codon:yes gene_type:complete
MIIFNLKCFNCDFNFEGWFENSKEYLKQNKKNLINCPSCESTNIDKGLMAPNLNKKSNSKKKNIKKSLASNMSKLKKIIEKNFDYVGENFTEEAKKIKYGEVEERSIYGEATLEQTKELIEEEIDIVPLPFSSKKTN